MPKEKMAEFIRNRLASHTIDDIRQMLRLRTIGEGHLADMTTTVETDQDGDVVRISSPMQDQRFKKPKETAKPEEVEPIEESGSIGDIDEFDDGPEDEFTDLGSDETKA